MPWRCGALWMLAAAAMRARELFRPGDSADTTEEEATEPPREICWRSRKTHTTHIGSVRLTHNAHNKHKVACCITLPVVGSVLELSPSLADTEAEPVP